MTSETSWNRSLLYDSVIVVLECPLCIELPKDPNVASCEKGSLLLPKVLLGDTSGELQHFDGRVLPLRYTLYGRGE